MLVYALMAGAVVIATVVLLGIGTAFGYRFGLQAGSGLVAIAPPPEPAPNPDLVEQVKIYHDLVYAMHERSGAVIRIAAPHFQSLPPSFKQALEGLAEVTKQLAAQLDRFGTDVKTEQVLPTTAFPTSPWIRQSETTQECESSSESATRPVSALTSDEIEQLAGSGDSADSPLRYSYDCVQTVYPCYEDGSHAVNAGGIPVRCRDISAHGIAFLLPDNPDFERLIISLGNSEHRVQMGAAVLHTRSVFMNGQLQVLVGCKFTGRGTGQNHKHINTREVAAAQ